MRKNTGFTLIELMIVIAIIGFGLTVAIPSFQGMFLRNSISSDTNSYLLAVNLARSEAMRRGSVVSIQSLDGGAEADNEFGNGYCVQVGQPGAAGFSNSCTYVDARCNPTQTTGCVLRSFSELSGSARFDSIEGVSALTFGSLGEVSASAVRNIDLCVDGEDGRRVHVSLIGRPRSHKVGDPVASKRPTC